MLLEIKAVVKGFVQVQEQNICPFLPINKIRIRAMDNLGYLANHVGTRQCGSAIGRCEGRGCHGLLMVIFRATKQVEVKKEAGVAVGWDKMEDISMKLYLKNCRLVTTSS